ncbi:MAG: type IV pilus twitching motility protein PilT [Myxococcaceae bacterium]
MSPDDQLLGRIAVHYKLISQDQLSKAFASQMGAPGKNIAQVLQADGVLTGEQVTWLMKAKEQYLAKQANASAPAPAASPAAAPTAPAAPPPSSRGAIGSKPGVPAAAPPAPAPTGPAPAASPMQPKPTSTGFTLHQILQKAMQGHASDVHVHSGAPIQMRIAGALKEMRTGQMLPDQVKELLFSVLDERQAKQLEETHDLDFALQTPFGRFRVSMYKQQRGFDGVFRAIPPEPPRLELLGMPKVLTRLIDYHQGLVLLTGPAGSGKSTTLASLVNMINETRDEHIITVEDPIEFVHPQKKCVVNQREAGRHTKSFANALRASLREDPDVIVIGELRDLETISLAISAAETGHLVMGTLHTNNAIRTINRILDVFPPKQQAQIRAMVSESLRAVVSQRLLPHADGVRRICAVETLFVNPAVSNLIRDEKTFQLKSIMQTGRAHGNCLLDDSLFDLYKANQITKEVARRAAEDPKRFV